MGTRSTPDRSGSASHGAIPGPQAHSTVSMAVALQPRRTHLARWIRAAARLGHPVMRITLGSPRVPWHRASALLVDRLIEPTRRAAEGAAEMGVGLAIENHGDLRAEEMLEVIERTGATNLGVTLDNVNLIRVGDDMLAGTRALASRTLLVQLKDHPPTPDPVSGVAPVSVALGEGVAPLREVVAILDAAGLRWAGMRGARVPRPRTRGRARDDRAQRRPGCATTSPEALGDRLHRHRRRRQMAMARLPFVDTHVHFSDLQDPNLHYAWLQPGWKHPILGDIEGIQAQRYWADEFVAETRFSNVSKSIHVQAALGIADPVEETKWLQAFADRLGHPHGIVAEVHLQQDDAQAVIERHMAYPNLRGVRDFGPGDYLVDRAMAARIRPPGAARPGGLPRLVARDVRQDARPGRDVPGHRHLARPRGLPSQARPGVLRDVEAGAREPRRGPECGGQDLRPGHVRQPLDRGVHPPVGHDLHRDVRCRTQLLRYQLARRPAVLAATPTSWTRTPQIISGFSRNEQEALFHANAERIFRILASTEMQRSPGWWAGAFWTQGRWPQAAVMGACSPGSIGRMVTLTRWPSAVV